MVRIENFANVTDERSKKALIGLPKPSGKARWSIGSGAPIFVWSVWTLTLLTALVFVGKYGVPVPYCDDWVFVPYLTGDEPITLSWLWSQQNEHRIVLFRLVTIGLLKLTGGDFRAPAFFSALAFGGLSLAMVLVTSSLRGRTSIADAFFPLILLRWGEIQAMGATGLFYYLPVMVTLVLLVIIVKKGTRPAHRTGVLAGICVVLLALCGGPGLLLVPGFGLWLSYSGVVMWLGANRLRGLHDGQSFSALPQSAGTPESTDGDGAIESTGHPARYEVLMRLDKSLLTLALAFIALLIVPLYFIDYSGVPSHLPSPGLQATLLTSLEVLTGSLSEGGSKIWPFSGIAVLVLVALTSAILAIRLVRTRGAERSQALGLCFFMGAVGCLVLGLGWGRSGAGVGAGFSYGVLGVPALCCIYLVWGICTMRIIGTCAQFALAAFGALMILPDAPKSIEAGADLRQRVEAFERDLRNGVPTFALIARHQETICPEGDEPDLSDAMDRLRRARISGFQHLRRDPRFRKRTLPLTPTTVNDMEWTHGTGHGTGSNSFLTFALSEPAFVAGIRIRFSHSNYATLDVQVSWKKSHESAFPGTPQYHRPRGHLTLVPGENTLTIYIADSIDEIRVHPDSKPFEIHISEIVLLTPANYRDSAKQSERTSFSEHPLQMANHLSLKDRARRQLAPPQLRVRSTAGQP